MKNVLVVDDSQIMRNIVKNSFAALDIPCRFLEATNGKDALNQLEENKIDLVLLDWNMPKLSGIEFLKRVRDDERYTQLPVIMVTSEAAKYNVVEALQAGATDYIIKPVNEQKFREKISKIKL
ncbi:MAG: response regulator [Spirochaetia bacterium]|jgi:two-component system chemotaxis response regulator CheY|nr:response regulator [Spirochaetia bacterium]